MDKNEDSKEGENATKDVDSNNKEWNALILQNVPFVEIGARMAKIANLSPYSSKKQSEI